MIAIINAELVMRDHFIPEAVLFIENGKIAGYGEMRKTEIPPNRIVYENETYIADMGEEALAILYPDLGSFRDRYNEMAYQNLDKEMLRYMNSLWENVKIN